MAKVHTYLNFNENTEEAFNFYKSVFGGEFSGLIRVREHADEPGMDIYGPDSQDLILHISLPILGDHYLMGTDVPNAMGKVVFGNSTHIFLSLDDKPTADKYFKLLAAGGKTEMEMQPVFWDAYFGSLIDKFGIQWMFEAPIKK